MSDQFSNKFSSNINNLYYSKRDHVCSNIDRDKIMSMFSNESIANLQYQHNFPIKKRIRLSKLDAHFNIIAEFMAKRAPGKLEGETHDGYQLTKLIEIIKYKTGIEISKSALSRYISNHPLVKEL